ncbi:DUF202 domain-containing protein [Lacticaseibacillus zhaodongensis]|uniref:DUF202 domain-containing protein n=1 Tax=Lacticaseibacillus zhaodongensis TaxID=2668065 RepID=UPI0012D3548E|nr:DUF202 domain-containing protein [Lacticaseibacillus zhaodongensis]
MTLEELKAGYEKEVSYQKHMLDNIGYFFQLATVIGGIGIVLVYYFHARNLWLNILGIALLVLGVLGMMAFGYAGWKGQRNVNAVIDDYDKKLAYLHKQTKVLAKKNS